MSSVVINTQTFRNANAEEVTAGALYHLLRKLKHPWDAKQCGAIDIGLGTSAFYFQLFRYLQFDTVAVDPVLSESAQIAIEESQAKFVRCCISDQDGMVRLYHGEFNGCKLTDLNSLNPKWWGGSVEFTEVPALSLRTLADKAFSSEKLACLKVDVEGAERSVIEGIGSLPEPPAVVCFEFGGGAEANLGEGGWSEEFVENTSACFSILESLGYRTTVIVSQCGDLVTTQSHVQCAPQCMDFIPQNAHFGNAICIRPNAVRDDRDLSGFAPWVWERPLFRRRLRDRLSDFLGIPKRKLSSLEIPIGKKECS